MQATATERGSQLGEELYALVTFLHKHCTSDLFEALGAVDLSLTQVKLLHYLEASPEQVTLKGGAEMVHVSLPAASRMVDDLVRRGFVERTEDAEDRRMKRISLTDDGRAVISKINAARLYALQEFVDGLTDAERTTLGGALTKLLKRPEVAACRP